MFCYWYKDCRGKDTTNVDYFKFVQIETLCDTTLLNLAAKEQFKCFEVLHKPTCIRMITLQHKQINYGSWHK